MNTSPPRDAGSLPDVVLGAWGGVPRSIAFSAGGNRIAVGSGALVWILDAVTGEPRGIRGAHNSDVIGLTYMPGLLISGSEDAISIWNRRRIDVPGHQLGSRVAVAPDGSHLIAGTRGRSVRLISVRTGEVSRTYALASGELCDATFLPGGRAAVTVSTTGEVESFHRSEAGAKLVQLPPTNAPYTIAMSPSGAELVCGTAGGDMLIVRLAKDATTRVLQSHSDAVRSLEWSPNGGKFASGSADHTVRLWDAASGEYRALIGHDGDVECVTFHPEGHQLASSSSDGTIRIWRADSGTAISTFAAAPAIVNELAFSPDGARLAVGTADGALRTWDCKRGELVSEAFSRHGAIRGLAWSPDGNKLAVGTEKGFIELQTPDWQAMLRVSDAAVVALAFSPDGENLAFTDGEDISWFVSVGSEPAPFPVTPRRIHTGVVPGEYIVSEFGKSKNLQKWLGRSIDHVHTATVSPFTEDEILVGDHVIRTTGHTITSLAISTSGRLAYATVDQSIHLWDPAAHSTLERCYYGAVKKLAFSPDGLTLVSVAADDIVRVWAVPEGRCLASFAAAKDGWVAHATGTPFFARGGSASSKLIRYRVGSAVMPADLWAPLFERPDLVAQSLSGAPLDLKALGLGSYLECDAALARKRAPIARRRSRPAPTRATESRVIEPNRAAPRHTFSLPFETFALAARVSGKRPPITITVDATGLPGTADVSAELRRGQTAWPLTLRRKIARHDRADAHVLELQLDAPEPGAAILTIDVKTSDGASHRDSLPITLLLDNPYIAGPPITHPRDFFGREEEISAIMRDLDKASIAMIGPMRIGKSSLLHQIHQRWGANSIFVSLQQFAGRADTLLPELAMSIAPGETFEGHPYNMLDRAVLSRLESLAQRGGRSPRFLVILDEAQFLSESRANDARHQLRALFQARQGDGLRALVAGPPGAMRLLSSDQASSPFLNMFQLVRLGPMTLQEISRLVRTPIGDEITVTDEAVARIHEICGGQPLIAQLICHDAIDTLRSRNAFRLGADEVEHVFREKVFDKVIQIFSYEGRWAALPADARSLLVDLSNAGPAARERLEQKTLRLLAQHDLADLVKKKISVEPTFLLWVGEVKSS